MLKDILTSLAVGAAAGLALFLVMWVITTFAIVKVVVVGILTVVLALAAIWAIGEIIREFIR